MLAYFEYFKVLTYFGLVSKYVLISQIKLAYAAFKEHPIKLFVVDVQSEYFLFLLPISLDSVFISLLLLLFGWKSIEPFIC